MGGSKPTIGYKYYLGLHAGICVGPVDEVRAIYFDEKEGWRGSITGNGTISIAKPGLFGGEKKEGGVAGNIDVLMGGPAQGTNAYLASQLGGDVPAFRGLLSLVFRGVETSEIISSGGLVLSLLATRNKSFYWSAMNPYIKPVSVEVRRILQGWSTAVWYPEKAVIGRVEVTSNAQWQYQTAALTVPPDPETWAASAPASGWNNGAAPFGLAQSFTPPVPINTSWPKNTAIWIRKTINISAPTTLTISGKVENAAFFYFDGQYLGAANPSNSDASTLVNYSFGVVAEAGPHTILIYALDESVDYGSSDNTYLLVEVSSGADMNPAHIIYQCITDPQWGAGLPSALIDDDAARAAADTLFDEGFGLSLQWAQQTSVESFIAEILRHIDGSLYLDQSTGKFVLSLNRFNYNPATLPIYNEDQIVEVEEYKRAAWGETTNEIVLTYTDASTEEPATVSVQNLANIRIQGGIVSASRNYSGIRHAGLAYRVAERDLRVVSTPLAMLTFTINRSAWQTAPGGVFRINWPDLGLSDVVFRAVEVDYGSLTNGVLRIQAVEDVFALPTNTYGGGQGSSWTDPSGSPADIATVRVVEANYVDAIYGLGEAEVAELSPTETFPFVMAESPSPQNLEAAVYVSPDTVLDNYIQTDEGVYTPTAIAVAAADQTVETVAYSNAKGFSWDGALGATAYWDDEIVLIESVDSSTQTLTIKRGVLDSVPQQHSAGSKIWFHDQQMGVFVGMAGLVSGETAYLRTVGSSTSQQSALGSAPVSIFVGSARWNKPWPPANVKINGDYYPSVIRGNFTITWVGRNRIQQNVDYVGWYEDHVVPESGTTYTLEIYDADTNNHIRTVTGLTTTSTGGSYTYPGFNTANATRFRIRLFAVRGGIASHHVWEHSADLVGYGLNYDQSYGGFTEGIVLPPSTTNVIPETQYTPLPDPYWINGAWRDLSSGIFWSSYDNGVTWGIETQGATNLYYDTSWIVHGNDHYVRFTGSGTKIAYRKTGGLWKELDVSAPPGTVSSSDSIMSVTFDGTKFVMLKYGGKDIYTCVDPSTETWSRVGSAGVTNQLNSRHGALFLMKVGAQYVALGAKDSKMWASTSADLVSWSAAVEVPSELVYFRDKGAFFNGYYFMPKPGLEPSVPMRLLRSTDLVSWTEVDIGAVAGMYNGFLVVLSNAIYVVSLDFVVKSTNGTSFSVSRSYFHYPNAAALLRAKRTMWTDEAGPNRAILLQPYNKEQGGKLLYMNALEVDWASVALLYPSDAINGKNIGVLGRWAPGTVEDSGFLVSDMTTNTTPTGLLARNSGKRYFEIKLVSKNVPYSASNSAPLIHRVGVSTFGKAGDGSVSSFGMNSNGYFTLNGEFNTAPTVGAYTFEVGQVFGIEVDFGTRVGSIYVDNVLFATVDNIDITQRWVPVVGAYGCTLELNLGQKSFAYSRPGVTAWLN